MPDRALASQRSGAERDDAIERSTSRPGATDTASPATAGPVGMLMALQRSAGNAAVGSLVRMPSPRIGLVARAAAVQRVAGGPVAMQRHAGSHGETEEPTAPEVAEEEATVSPGTGTGEAGPVGDTPPPGEGDGGAAGAGAGGGSAGGGAAGAGSPTVDDIPAEPDDKERKLEDIEAKEAEGETGSESDDPAPEEGSAYPIAGEAATQFGGFDDAGRRAKVPFTDAMLEHFQIGRDMEPRAFTAGGRSGTKAWAGGGGAGPKGNQKAGSIQTQVEPEYESRMVGLATNADAWVKEGTGVVDVSRSYVSSDAGDQGNGWFVTAKATAALEKHEQRHVAASRANYVSYIQPLLDKVAASPQLGKGKTYWQSDARALLKQQIDWKNQVKKFTEGDEADNAPNMIVDTEDYGSAAYPRQIGPGKVGGKDFTNRLVMNSEPDPT